MSLLVGDIGGTNCRFGLVSGASLRPQAVAVEHGDDHKAFDDAVAAYLEKSGTRPRRAAFAIAGPVRGRRAQLTNRAAWAFDADSLARRFGFEQVDLINDFVAQAASLPHLEPNELVAIGAAAPVDETKAALGPGTGLGVAALIRDGDRWLPMPSEAGHVELASIDAREAAIFALVRQDFGRVSAEAVLSGLGLPRLHRAIAQVDGRTPDDASSPEITAAAIAGEPVASETIGQFLVLLARFSGDVALAFGARGGVYLCGGIMPRLVGLVDADAFRAGFETKRPHEAMLRQIATVVVSSDVSGLVGCAAVAQAR